jgi:hypothetical protein
MEYFYRQYGNDCNPDGPGWRPEFEPPTSVR